MGFSHRGFTITLRRTTLGRTPLDEWSARFQRPKPDNTQHSLETSMCPVEIEPVIPEAERPQTHALDRAATGTSTGTLYWTLICTRQNDSHHIYVRSIPTFSFNPQLGFPTFPYHSAVPTNIRATCPSHPLLLNSIILLINRIAHL